MNAHNKTVNLIFVFIFFADMIFAQLKTRFDYCVYTSSDGKKSEMINVYKPAIAENNLKSKSFINADCIVWPYPFYPDLSIIDKNCFDFILNNKNSIDYFNSGIFNKNSLLYSGFIKGVDDYKSNGSLNSSRKEILNPYNIFIGHDFTRSFRKPFLLRENVISERYNKYINSIKAPEKYNIDYAFLDFHDIYFSTTESNDRNYVSGNEMYYSKRGYFLSANDNNPRYMSTQGIYNNDDDLFILLWLFDIFSEINRK